jgi:hypothetical protein
MRRTTGFRRNKLRAPEEKPSSVLKSHPEVFIIESLDEKDERHTPL